MLFVSLCVVVRLSCLLSLSGGMLPFGSLPCAVDRWMPRMSRSMHWYVWTVWTVWTVCPLYGMDWTNLKKRIQWWFASCLRPIHPLRYIQQQTSSVQILCTSHHICLTTLFDGGTSRQNANRCFNNSTDSTIRQPVSPAVEKRQPQPQ